MRSDKASELQESGLRPTHEEGGSHHADGYQLSWNGEEEEASLLTPRILIRSVCHGQNEGGEKEDLAQEILCQNLFCC